MKQDGLFYFWRGWQFFVSDATVSPVIYYLICSISGKEAKRVFCRHPSICVKQNFRRTFRGHFDIPIFSYIFNKLYFFDKPKQHRTRVSRQSVTKDTIWGIESQHIISIVLLRVGVRNQFAIKSIGAVQGRGEESIYELYLLTTNFEHGTELEKRQKNKETNNRCLIPEPKEQNKTKANKRSIAR